MEEMEGKFDNGHQLPKFLYVSNQMGEESRQQAQAGITAVSRAALVSEILTASFIAQPTKRCWTMP